MALAFWGAVVLVGLLIPLGLTAWILIAKKKLIPTLAVPTVALASVVVGGIAIRAMLYILGTSIQQFL